MGNIYGKDWIYGMTVYCLEQLINEIDWAIEQKYRLNTNIIINKNILYKEIVELFMIDMFTYCVDIDRCPPEIDEEEYLNQIQYSSIVEYDKGRWQIKNEFTYNYYLDMVSKECAMELKQSLIDDINDYDCIAFVINIIDNAYAVEDIFKIINRFGNWAYGFDFNGFRSELHKIWFKKEL